MNVVQVLKVPCGQCRGCRLRKSAEWATRCMHEATLHTDNCFITLTYNDDNLPHDFSLDVTHFQKFMKRLRFHFAPKRIRFFHCGEYGDKFGRPHYHAIIFGLDFDDKVFWTTNNGFPLYRSKTLDELWPYGFSSIGAVTFESAAYVARYNMKKVNGKKAKEHYEWIHPITGQIFDRKPEYITMSRRPGIASDWFDRYYNDVYPHDRVIVNGRPLRPPRFYDGRFELINPSGFEQVKFMREERSKLYIDNNTPDRLLVREKVLELSLKRLPRPLD